MICKNCGANMADGVRSCTVCGADMGASAFMRAADLDDGFVSQEKPVQTAATPEVYVNMGSAPNTPAAPAPAPKQYCTSCGASMETGSRFCTVCCAGVEPVKPATAGKVEEWVTDVTTKVWDTGNGAVKGKSKKRLYMIGGAVVAMALLIGIGLFALLGGRSAEATVKKYIQASLSGDVKAMLKLFPEDVIEYAIEEEGYDSDEYDEFCEDGEKTLKKVLDSYEDYVGDDWEYSFESVVLDDVSNKKLRDIQEKYEDEFDIKVKDAKTAEVEITIEGEGAEKSVTQKLALIKIGNSWYLDFATMGGLI